MLLLSRPKGYSADLPITTGGVLLLGTGCGRAFGGKTTFRIQKPEECWQASRAPRRTSGQRGVPDTMADPGGGGSGGGLLRNVPVVGDWGFSLWPGISGPRALWLINQAHADTRTTGTCRAIDPPRSRAAVYSPKLVSIINLKKSRQ